jgi:hypothetical protein
MSYYNPNRKDMKVNVDHPSFISFLENISNNILSAIKIEDYFTLTSEKKTAVSFTVLNLIRASAKIKTNLSDSELKSFITILWKKHEDAENYEFAAVLNDVVKNYDIINSVSSETTKTVKKYKKTSSDSEHQE